MPKKALSYGAFLIGTYLVLSHYKAAGGVFTAGANGGSRFVKTLQGR